VIEVHGNRHDVVCYRAAGKDRCARPSSAFARRIRSALRALWRHPESDTISFGAGARAGGDRPRDAGGCGGGLLISVGTSLQVYPIAGAVPAAKTRCARGDRQRGSHAVDGIRRTRCFVRDRETLPRMVGMAARTDAGALGRPMRTRTGR